MATTPEATAAAAAPSATDSKSNPRVFFDITIGGVAAGRIVMEL